jgi:predicted ATP-dependent serine protease
MSPFLPRPVKDLADETAEAPDWLIHHLLPRGTLGLLVAYPKVGKSTLASQLAVAVAQGRDFLGRPTKQGGVLYVVAEERRDDVMRRLRHFGMADTDPIWLWTETVKDTETDRSLMSKFVADKTIALIIIDTWASYLMIQEETNNSQVTLRMKPYVDMAHASGVVVLFVHHERKNREEGNDGAQAIRGGGAILGLADLALQLQRDGNSTGRKLKIVGRYPDVPLELKLAYEEEGYVSLGTPEEASVKALRAKVLAVLPTEEPGFTVEEVMGLAKTKKGATRRALEEACAGKSAERTGGGKKNDPYRYRRVVVTQESDVAMEMVTIGAGDKDIAEV